MLLTFDSNLVIYAYDLRESGKRDAATLLLLALEARRTVLAVQVCGEVYNVLSGKMRFERAIAARLVSDLLNSYPVFAATQTSVRRALAEAAAGRFSFWDANLLSAAEAAGCTHILSEDMADGSRLGRLEVVAPFGPDGVSSRARDLLQL